MATKTITPEEFAEAFQSWTVLDVIKVMKLLEEMGIKPAAPVAVAAAASGGGAAEAAAPEQTEFTVILTGPGDSKINVIKAVREATGLGLKEAKDVVDQAPKAIKEGITREEADALKAKIEEAGGSVEVK